MSSNLPQDIVNKILEEFRQELFKKYAQKDGRGNSIDLNNINISFFKFIDDYIEHGNKKIEAMKWHPQFEKKVNNIRGAIDLDIGWSYINVYPYAYKYGYRYILALEDPVFKLMEQYGVENEAQYKLFVSHVLLNNNLKLKGLASNDNLANIINNTDVIRIRESLNINYENDLKMIHYINQFYRYFDKYHDYTFSRNDGFFRTIHDLYKEFEYLNIESYFDYRAIYSYIVDFKKLTREEFLNASLSNLISFYKGDELLSGVLINKSGLYMEIPYFADNSYMESLINFAISKATDHYGTKRTWHIDKTYYRDKFVFDLANIAQNLCKNAGKNHKISLSVPKLMELLPDNVMVKDYIRENYFIGKNKSGEEKFMLTDYILKIVYGGDYVKEQYWNEHVTEWDPQNLKDMIKHYKKAKREFDAGIKYR